MVVVAVFRVHLQAPKCNENSMCKNVDQVCHHLGFADVLVLGWEVRVRVRVRARVVG